jgi:hypothetical protein
MSGVVSDSRFNAIIRGASEFRGTLSRGKYITLARYVAVNHDSSNFRNVCLRYPQICAGLISYTRGHHGHDFDGIYNNSGDPDIIAGTIQYLGKILVERRYKKIIIHEWSGIRYDWLICRISSYTRHVSFISDYWIGITSDTWEYICYCDICEFDRDRIACSGWDNAYGTIAKTHMRIGNVLHRTILHQTFLIKDIILLDVANTICVTLYKLWL